MTNPIFIISTILGFPALVASILSQVEFWQRKEYRTDRVLVALKSGESSDVIYTYATSLALAAAGWVILSRGNLHYANLAGLTSLAVIFFFYFRRAVSHGIFRPQGTTKARLLLLTTTFITVAYLFNSSFPRLVLPLHWATIILLTPIITTLSVYLVNLVTDWRKHQIINQAAKHRQKLTKLKVIGITGSYGKTSTKYFLSQLVPDAIVSKEHRNSPFPIAQDMLEQLNSTSQTYVVEMGAYRCGEIKELASLTQPQLGLITAIGNQHLATFSSPAKILQAKWELIEALPEDGVAILNGDDATIQKVEEAPAKKICYSIKHPADIYAENVDVKPLTISCRLHIKDFRTNVDIPLAGIAALSNVVAAVAAAHALGASNNQIVSRLKNFKPYPSTMEVITTKEDSTVIDDSYSANEQGVMAAIAHLEKFPQSDKRIALVPLIELGSQAKPVHQRIGQALAKSGARVYIYGQAYQKELTSSFKNNSRVQVVTRPAELIKKATHNLSNNTIILLEGRLPASLLQKLKS